MEVRMKSVLVSYLGRNKIITIPERKKDSDQDYVKKEFCNLFVDDPRVSLSAALCLQKFDTEWNEYIDLDVDQCCGNA